VALVLYGVIKSFRDAETERLWKEERSRRIPANLHKQALKKLQMLNAATALTDLLVPPGNRLDDCMATAKANTASASMTSTAFASSGAKAMHSTSRSRIITEETAHAPAETNYDCGASWRDSAH